MVGALDDERPYNTEEASDETRGAAIDATRPSASLARHLGNRVRP